MSIRLFDDLRTVSFFFFFKDTEIETFEVFPKLSSYKATNQDLNPGMFDSKASVFP